MIKTILWDFDGVILDSMKIKGDGFKELFKEYDKKYLDLIEAYHYRNGGVSRFEKIRYFYEEILDKEILDDEVEVVAKKFAKIITKNLFDSNNLILDSLNFIEKNYQNYNFHIVSGAEEHELTELCQYFHLDKYFITINGSPTKKSILVKNILEKYGYKKNETILIGDAITDYNASVENEITFYGYNNSFLKEYGNYIYSFDKLFITKIEWIDNNLEILKKEFNDEISSKITKYYPKIINISNPVLSRNIYSSNIFKYFCFFKYDGSIPNPVSFKSKIIKLLKYYVKSFIHLSFISIHAVIYKLSYRKNMPNQKDDIVLIDTFTMIDKIYSNGFKDNYFDKIYTVLEKEQNNFAILSILFGDKPYHFIKRYKTYKLLQKSKYIFISEFKLLKLVDYFELFIFMLKYPWQHIDTKDYDSNTFSLLYNVSIDETIDKVQVYNYVRYLFGKRLGNYFDKNIKLISWDENQVIHKLLNKGLRDSTNNKINIIGTKFFGFAPNWVSLENIDSEINCNVSPNVILTKGKYFTDYYHTSNVKVGFSTRESYLFDLNINTNKKNNLGILLGYDIVDNISIIDYIKNVNINSFESIIIRLHPNHKLNCPFDIPTNWIIDDGSLVDFSTNCKKIVSIGTGAALELMVLGNFIIMLGKEDNITTNTLVENLKGINWDIFYTKEQLNNLLNLDYNYEKVDINLYFKKVTDEIIIESLELK